MNETIWLEVTNVRLGKNEVHVQVKGDKNDHEPVWWEVGLLKAGFGKDHNAAYRAISEGLDKKKLVLAGLVPKGTELICGLIRIQYAESTSR